MGACGGMGFGSGHLCLWSFHFQSQFLSALGVARFFLIFSVLGFVRFAVFGGLWAGWHAAEIADGSIRAAFRNQLPGQIGFILAMTWFAIWRPPKIIAETRNRIRITPN